MLPVNKGKLIYFLQNEKRKVIKKLSTDISLDKVRVLINLRKTDFFTNNDFLIEVLDEKKFVLTDIMTDKDEVKILSQEFEEEEKGEAKFSAPINDSSFPKIDVSYINESRGNENSSGSVFQNPSTPQFLENSFVNNITANNISKNPNNSDNSTDLLGKKRKKDKNNFKQSSCGKFNIYIAKLEQGKYYIGKTKLDLITLTSSLDQIDSAWTIDLWI